MTASTSDTTREILLAAAGRGGDSAIERLGAQATFETCITATRPGGTIAVIGHFGGGDYVRIPRTDRGAGLGGKTKR